eukprot:TRINITY_DN1605_c0_g1_i1.p1 TRINITY_DN1605_c0_g1~~TRINITY_DN1605_c0_g1_i1.p1  ORF type:complete len:557 (-),score=106.03 TRINITY_DN1605_c0_g1_i1:35-1705(-)
MTTGPPSHVPWPPTLYPSLHCLLSAPLLTSVLLLSLSSRLIASSDVSRCSKMTPPPLFLLLFFLLLLELPPSTTTIYTPTTTSTSSLSFVSAASTTTHVSSSEHSVQRRLHNFDDRPRDIKERVLHSRHANKPATQSTTVTAASDLRSRIDALARRSKEGGRSEEGSHIGHHISHSNNHISNVANDGGDFQLVEEWLMRHHFPSELTAHIRGKGLTADDFRRLSRDDIADMVVTEKHHQLVNFSDRRRLIDGIARLNEIESMCPRACSGHGLCDSACVCDLGFTGRDCSIPATLRSDVKLRFDSFDKIYREAFWESEESISGRGSELKQTMKVIKIVSDIIARYNIKSVLDAPCGDENWMQYVTLNGSLFVGADIVQPLIQRNRVRWPDWTSEFGYQWKSVDADQWDPLATAERDHSGTAWEQLRKTRQQLIPDPSPRLFWVMDMAEQVPYRPFDLIVCRDALVHLPNKDVRVVLDRINRSGSKYLLTTLFSEHSPKDIARPGMWRQINFLSEPWNFPKPLELHNEAYWGVVDKSKPYFNDKALGLWKLPLPLPDI